MTIETQITEAIKNNDIVVYMRGTPQAPRCGFSATVVQIFSKLGADFAAFNADESAELWEALSTRNDWPTMPQIYIKGEFMGGCDILKEMYLSGELQQLLQEKGISAA